MTFREFLMIEEGLLLPDQPRSKRDEPDQPVALHECRPTQADAEEAAEGRAVQAVTGQIIVALLAEL